MEVSKQKNESSPKWYRYLSAFLGGVFIMNLVPHFINGVTGHSFPTPFADPPGEGLSTPTLNILWAAINFVIGFTFLKLARINRCNKWLWAAVFLGSLLMAFYLSSYFGAWQQTHNN